MHKMWVTGLAASIGLAGWTNIEGAELLSAKGPVIAILADELFVGEAEGNLNGAGTLAMRSQKHAGAYCMGEFTSTSELGGSGQLRCSDGLTATFHFQRLGLVRGYGAGSSSRGALSFTYGLGAAESESYLKVPAGRRLARSGNKLDLVHNSPAQAGASAPDVAPDVLLTAITAEVIAVMRQDRALQAGNPAKVAELVEARILPHFDFSRMTQNAVAQNWRLATPEQQKALAAEFKTLLVRTYSVALTSYRDQVIEYKPLRAAPEATEVTVKSEVKQAGSERTTIDYDMARTPGGWKVYDIKIAGISLVSTYRQTFSGRVRDGGIDGLIKSLADKNRQGG